MLTFHTPELAELARVDYDGFVVDDGELSKPMCILAHSDYVDGIILSLTLNIGMFSFIVKILAGKHLKPQNVPENLEPEKVDLQKQAKATSTPVCKKKTETEEKTTLHHDETPKGKAGNLWSAQIVSNRAGDGAWDAIV